MKKTYFLIFLVIYSFGLYFHIKLPYCEEWMLYDLFLKLGRSEWGQLPHLFDYQSNHIILVNRFFYFLDYIFSLKGSLVLLFSALFNVLACYYLEAKIFVRERSVFERVLLYSVFFSLKQYESFIHPHILNYSFYNFTLVYFIYYMNESYKASTALVASGFNLLSWISLLPVFLVNLVKIKKNQFNRYHVAILVGFLFLSIVYSNAIHQDPYHPEMFWSFVQMTKYFTVSYSTLIPYLNSTDIQLYVGFLALCLCGFVFYRGSYFQRAVLIAGISHFIIISIGRYSPYDPEFGNALRSRYYTFLAPTYFVLFDFCFIRFSKWCARFIKLGLSCLVVAATLYGIESSNQFDQRRKEGISCLMNYIEMGTIIKDCNTIYLFDAGYSQPSKGKLNETKADLILTSKIVRQLGYFNK